MIPVNPQYTFDKFGRAVGVFLPIEDWNVISEELNLDLSDSEKTLIDTRLSMFEEDPQNLISWEKISEQLDKEDEAI